MCEFLNFKERLILRKVNINFLSKFKNFKCNLKFSNRNLNKKLKFCSLNFENVNVIILKNLKIEKSFNFENFSVLLSKNQNSVKILRLNNLKIEDKEISEIFLNLLSTLNQIEEISLINSDENATNNKISIFPLLLLLPYKENSNQAKSKEIFPFFKKIKILKIKNFSYFQILNFIEIFLNLEFLSIENNFNSLEDKNIESILEKIILNSKNLTFFDLKLNSDMTGTSSLISSNTIHNLLKHFPKLQKLSLSGLNFKQSNIPNNNYNCNSNSESDDNNNEEKYCSKDKTLLNYLEIKNAKNLKNLFFIFNFSFLNLKTLNFIDSYLSLEDLHFLFSNLCFDLLKLEDLTLSKCIYLNDEVITLILKHKNSLQNLKSLNLSFNQEITSSGFNLLLENLNSFKNLKDLDFRNCYISLESSKEHMKNALFLKGKEKNCFETLNLYFIKFTEKEYIDFFKYIYFIWSDINSKYNIDDKMDFDFFNRKPIKINLKLKTKTNLILFNKVKTYFDILSKNCNVLIK